MFPKSVSGTSGKLRENKGDDMTEMNLDDAMLREKLKDVVHHLKNGSDLSFHTDSAYAQAIIWASERIAELEGQTQSPERSGDETRDLFFRLGYGSEIIAMPNCEAVAWGQDRIKKLELENENLSKTILTISKSPQLASPDSDEEIYERRRRERLLDEVTLICVSRELEKMGHDSDDQLETGFRAREIASDIWAGINEFDLQL